MSRTAAKSTRLLGLGLCALALLLLSAKSSPKAHADVAPSSPRAVLLLAQSDGNSASVSFGKDAVTGGELARRIQAPFEKAGLVFVSAAGLTPIVGQRLPGLALGDEAAINLAEQAGARFAVSVGLAGRSGGNIRATSLVGQTLELRIRVLDLQAREVMYDKQVSQAGYGVDLVQAQAQGAARALAKAQASLPGVLALRLPSAQQAASASAQMSVSINGAQGWREVTAVLRRLAATQGVEAVHAVEIRENLVRLEISSKLSAPSMVSSLRRARIPNGSIAVNASGNAISVVLTITSNSQPINNG